MGARRGGRAGLIIIVLIIFVLVAAVVVIFASSILTPPPADNGSGELPPTPTEIPVTQIIVAGHDIRRGARLSQDDVKPQPWPDSSLPPNAMLVGGSPDEPGLEQVEGMIARVDILSDQPILSHMVASEQDLTIQASGSDAALLIPSGQVAVAFPLSRMAGVAYALRQGDHIDILMSYRFVSVDTDFQSLLPNDVGAIAAFLAESSGTEPPVFAVAGREENGPFNTRIMVVPSEYQRPRQVTQLVIKNAIVLRVGEWPQGDDAIVITPEPAPSDAAPTEEAAAADAPTPEPPPAPDVITLIMSRQDALVLKYSLETGTDIDFALRSALDNEVTDVSTDSVTLQYLLDFYDIVEPPLLPIAQDPSIDTVVDFDGNFLPGSKTTEVPAAPPS